MFYCVVRSIEKKITVSKSSHKRDDNGLNCMELEVGESEPSNYSLLMLTPAAEKCSRVTSTKHPQCG